MSTWTERAKAHFSKSPGGGTAKTAETPLDSVNDHENGTAETAKTPLSAVLAVRDGGLSEKRMFLDGAANDHGKRAANDPAKPRPVDWGPGTEPPADVQARLRAKSLALDAKQAGMPAADPDRASWPHSEAWNEAETALFSKRLLAFAGKGLHMSEAEALADKLVIRDRDQHDRRLCLECRNCLQSRCTNWRAAGLGQPGLPATLVGVLQRCGGFRPWE